MSSGSLALLHALTPDIRGDVVQLVGNIRFTAAGSAVNAGGPKVIRQARTIGEGGRFIAEMRVSRDREHGFHRIVSKYFAGS